MAETSTRSPGPIAPSLSRMWPCIPSLAAMINVALLAAATLGLASVPGAARPAVSAGAYARAERFLPWNKARLVSNEDVQTHWIGRTGRLWYRSVHPGGWTFMIADAASASRHPAFDHAAMADALARATGTRVSADTLPIDNLAFTGTADDVRVTALGKIFDCDPAARHCAASSEKPRAPDRLYSPHGKRAVFAHGPDVWVEDLASGQTRALTTDGEPARAYGTLPDVAGFSVTARRIGFKLPPSALFSPDGTRIVTYRLDARRVPEETLLQSVPEDGTIRPKPWTYRVPFGGDPPTLAELVVIDLVTGAKTLLAHPPLIVQVRGPLFLGQVNWSPDGRTIYVADYRDAYREVSLSRIDLATGAVRRLFTERDEAGVFGFFAPRWTVLADGGVLWPSQRSGWQQLYRYDRDGKLVGAVTRGPWVVREVLRVDDAGQRILFSASGREAGRDPYFRKIYSVRLDGGDLKRLTPEDADHQVRIAFGTGAREAADDPAAGLSPDGRWFVDAWSRPDLPTVTAIRDANGRIALPLEQAKLAPDIAPGFVLPEPFQALAADGRTAIYGILFKPAGFDPSRRYPVIDTIYGGPQAAFVSKRFLDEVTYYYGRPLSELGFVVVALDGRGTPLRSRAFQAASYGRMATAGFLEDHLAALHQLARTRPWMDIDRLGAFGYSAGGFAVLHAMFDYPDAFKVGTATSPGGLLDYDQAWGLRWQGLYDRANWAAQESYVNAAHLEGKLLLAVGDMDDNVPPSNTMRVADALIRANKDFDMLVVPNGNHMVSIESPYLIRRQWDYFVTNLLGADPPANYAIAPPGAAR